MTPAMHSIASRGYLCYSSPMFIDSGNDNLPDNDDYSENLDPTTEVPEAPTDLESATREWLSNPTLWASRVKVWHDAYVDETDTCPIPDDCIYGCWSDDNE